ncbi:MAG: hypothetical protein U0791_23195 [Gemmataceae bacterium]
MSLELHETIHGEHVGLGLLDPDPNDTVVYSPVGFRIRTRAEIQAELAGKSSQFRRREWMPWNTSQGRTNACNGHMTAGVLSRSLAVKTGGRLVVRLSGADAYSQMNGGRDAGSSLANGMRVVTNGIALEATVAEDDIYCTRNRDQAIRERPRFRGLPPIAVDEEEEFATGLIEGLFGGVAVQVDKRGAYESLDGRGVSRGGNGPGNHAVGIDDLRLAPDGVIEYGQFGSWGDHVAYVWLRWDQHLRETVKRHRFWLLAAAADDPEGDNPPPVNV